MDSYSYLATCANCHATEEYSIPKGTTASAFMIGQACTHCGLSMVSGNNDKGRVAGL